jgi:hypothetical protein
VATKPSKEERIYKLAVAEHLDPTRAVHAYRRVEAIADDATRAAVRRQLSGVVLPADDVDAQFFTIASKARGEQIEAAQKHADAFVESYYRKTAPAFLSAHLLFGCNDFFRAIVTKALAVHDNFFCEDGEGTTYGTTAEQIRKNPLGPDVLVAISTSRPGSRWIIRNGVTLSRVMEGVKQDSWCDIDISGTGYCIQGMREHKADKHAYLYDCVPNLPYLIPFSNGNVVIFGHICFDCWQAYTKKNKIRPDKTGIFQPIADGFGSL